MEINESLRQLRNRRLHTVMIRIPLQSHFKITNSLCGIAFRSVRLPEAVIRHRRSGIIHFVQLQYAEGSVDFLFLEQVQPGLV